MSIISFFQKEEQFIKLCPDKNAAISEFTILLDKGVRLNIHNKVY